MKYSELPRDASGKVIVAEVRFPVELDLLAPFEQPEGPPIEAVSLREPTAGELEIANKEPSGTATAIRMVSFSSGLSPDAVRMLGLRDYLRMSGLLLDFT